MFGICQYKEAILRYETQWYLEERQAADICDNRMYECYFSKHYIAVAVTPQTTLQPLLNRAFFKSSQILFDVAWY
jgi:hypothetical protein